MSCALGTEIRKQYYNAKYVRIPYLLIDLEMSRNKGAFKKEIAKYTNPLLLIIDEWLLLKPTDNEQKGDGGADIKLDSGRSQDAF